jgi:hypothetical protein
MTQRHMAVAHDPLPVPPMPWQDVGLEYPTQLHISTGFNMALIVVDFLTRVVHFLPCTKVTSEKTVTLVLHGVYRLKEMPRVPVNDRDPKFVNGLGHAL